MRSLDHAPSETDGEMHFWQAENGMVHNNSTALRQNLHRTLRFFRYAPAETIAHFFSRFAHSLSELEE